MEKEMECYDPDDDFKPVKRGQVSWQLMAFIYGAGTVISWAFFAWVL